MERKEVGAGQQGKAFLPLLTTSWKGRREPGGRVTGGYSPGVIRTHLGHGIPMGDGDKLEPDQMKGLPTLSHEELRTDGRRGGERTGS